MEINVSAVSVHQGFAPRKVDSPRIDKIGILKFACPLVEIVNEVVHLRKRGTQLVGLCPFHSEETPSFYVRPDSGLFYCHGCGQGGDVIRFVQAYHKLTFRDSLRWLASRAGIEVDAPISVQAREVIRLEKELRSIEKHLGEISTYAELEASRKLATERERWRYISNRLCEIHNGAAQSYSGERELLWLGLRDSFNGLRRWDAIYLILAFAANDERDRFLSAPVDEQAEIVNEVLERGYVADDRGHRQEVIA